MITGGTLEHPITDSPHRMSRMADSLLQLLPIDGILACARRARPPYRHLRRRIVTVTHIAEEGFAIAVDHELRFFDV